jgi:hypothetical protein
MPANRRAPGSVEGGMRRALTIAAVATTVALLAACSHGDEVVAGEGTSTTTPVQRYEISAMVEQVPHYGPRLCLLPSDDVAWLVPHPCGGPSVKGWDWDAVTGEERSTDGVIRGTYHLVGTYVPGSTDDAASPTTTVAGAPSEGGGVAFGAFTLTEPAGPPDPTPAQEMPLFPSACPPPAGGWKVVDRSTATHEGLQAAMEYALAQPDYAGGWLDQSLNPDLAAGLRSGAIVEEDPTRLVLNEQFTGDLARHEQELRALFGGPLCVVAGVRTTKSLDEIQHELFGIPGLMSTSPGLDGRLTAHVMADGDGAIQRRLDETYGPGVIVVTSELHPVP